MRLCNIPKLNREYGINQKRQNAIPYGKPLYYLNFEQNNPLKLIFTSNNAVSGEKTYRLSQEMTILAGLYRRIL